MATTSLLWGAWEFLSSDLHTDRPVPWVLPELPKGTISFSLVHRYPVIQFISLKQCTVHISSCLKKYSVAVHCLANKIRNSLSIIQRSLRMILAQLLLLPSCPRVIMPHSLTVSYASFFFPWLRIFLLPEIYCLLPPVLSPSFKAFLKNCLLPQVFHTKPTGIHKSEISSLLLDVIFLIEIIIYYLTIYSKMANIPTENLLFK